jgi:signal transduction histidine kinase
MNTAGRVLVLSDDAEFTASTCGVLAAQLPDASCDHLSPVRIRVAPDAAALVIDGRADGGAALDRAKGMRAMGYAGAMVIVGVPDDAMQVEAARFGCALVAPDAVASALVSGLADGLLESATPFAESVRRARRLVAAGEIALRLQHSLNNPLAAILAEAQLLQLDVTDEEQREALERIVAMCRRMVDLLHGLDGVGERAVR